MFANNLRTALRSLSANKLRSALTMLGIILGVGSVIIMLAAGAGAQSRIQEEIRALGANVMVLVPGAVNASGVHLGIGTRPSITEGDAFAIQNEIPAVAAASPTVRGTAQAIVVNANWTTTVLGVMPEYFVVREWGVVAGRLFDHDEARAARKVAVVGQTVVEKLFPDVDPIDQVIRVDKVPFVVVGVLERKGQSMGGIDQDDTVMMPLDAARDRVIGRNRANPRSVGGVLIKAQAGADMSETVDQIRELIRQRHKIQPGQNDDFWLRNLSDVLKAREGASRTMTLLLASVASVALVVGGIGIMNIMLVSVTERTREIGLRMAVGARRRDVMTQFLIEAVVLSTIGGLAGLILGVVGSFMVGSIGELPVAISPSAILVSLLFAALVGIFFGFYPARRAALLQPIDALRHE